MDNKFVFNVSLKLPKGYDGFVNELAAEALRSVADIIQDGLGENGGEFIIRRHVPESVADTVFYEDGTMAENVNIPAHVLSVTALLSWSGDGS